MLRRIWKDLYNTSKKSVSANNLHNHSVLEGTNTALVNGQNTEPVRLMRYGRNLMNRCGCEIIAVYNIMQLLSKPVPLPDIISEFELNRMSFLFFRLYGMLRCHLPLLPVKSLLRRGIVPRTGLLCSLPGCRCPLFLHRDLLPADPFRLDVLSRLFCLQISGVSCRSYIPASVTLSVLRIVVLIHNNPSFPVPPVVSDHFRSLDAFSIARICE